MENLIPQPQWNFVKLKTKEVNEDGLSEETENWAPGRWKTKMVREVLDKITPPTIYTKDNKTYKCKVSDEQATKREVQQLGVITEGIIKKRKFASSGIDNNRHEMYSALFDELIRQITIEFPELGAILIKIRDHFRQEILNYEQAYGASQAYGFRKVYMEKFDDRLHELEAEKKQILERQKHALDKMEQVHKNNRQKLREYSHIKIDKEAYWDEIEFYKNYINILLYYFEIQEEHERIIAAEKQGIVLAEEHVEEEEEVIVEEEESKTVILEELPEEEEEPVPILRGQDKDIVIEVKKKAEDQIDKDLIYRENEEEVFASDSGLNDSTIPPSPESSIEIIPPRETEAQEYFEKLYLEDMNWDVTYSDIERGYIKKAADAYYAEIKRAEDLQKLEEEEEETEIISEIDEEMEEEYSEESEEKGPLLKEEKSALEPKKEPSFWDTIEPFRLSVETSPIQQEVEKEMPQILDSPKYAIIRRLMDPIKCKDLIPTVPVPQVARKKKTKIIKVKKLKQKEKTIREVPKKPEDIEDEEIDASQLKSGLPLSATMEGLDQDEKRGDGEDKTGQLTKEESSDISSEFSIGKTESLHSSDISKDSETLTIDREEAESNEEKSGEEESLPLFL